MVVELVSLVAAVSTIYSTERPAKWITYAPLVVKFFPSVTIIGGAG